MRLSAMASGPKPSKVEAIKVASQYLSTYPGRGGPATARLAHQRGRGHRPEVPRVVPAGRPRPPHADEARGEGEGVPVHGPDAGPRRQARRPRSTWPIDDLARTVGNGTLRITTRQEFQLHGVLKDDLTATIRTDQRGRSSRPWPPAATSSGTCSAAPRRSTTRSATRCRPTATASPRTSPRGRRATGTSGSTARRSTTRSFPPAGPILVPTAGDDPVEPIYGKAYLPAQVQDGLRLARRQLHRRPRQRPRLPGGRRGRRARRLQRPGRRRPGHDAERREDVPVPGACRSATSTGPTCSRSARR